MAQMRSRRGSFARNLKGIEQDFLELTLDGGRSASARNQWFFEVAWEVANKG